MMHSKSCNCNTCSHESISDKEKEFHIAVSENSRREFLRTAGRLGMGLGAGAGLISPLAASALHGHDAAAKATEMAGNKAVKKGQAQLFTILHTADIHSQLFAHDEFFVEDGKPVYKTRGGLASLKTMVNTLRNENPGNTLLLDGGDCFQGGGVAALSEGRAIIPMMNNIGYDIMLPGNWEVVYGKDMMMRDMFGYNAVKICANMFHDQDPVMNGDLIFPPYYVTQVAGIKIGFIGYNDPLTPKRQSPDYSKGIRFTFPEESVAKYVRLLREYERCQMVFLVTHMGLAQQVGLAAMPQIKGVDYILGADTHERVRTPIDGAYAKVTEPGAFGSFIAKLDVVVEDGLVKDSSYQLLDVDPDKYKPDAEMLKLIEEQRKPYAKLLDKKIGSSKTPLVRYYVIETPMDNFITDAIMWKFKPDIALSNGFRFCPPLVPNPNTGLAEITEDYLWSMLPVDSEAKKGIASGRQIWDWMERELHNAFAKDPAQRFGGWVVRFQGMQMNFTIGNEKGKRVNWIKVAGQPIALEKQYTFIACEREGDPDTTLCRMEGVASPSKLGFSLHQIIREYLAVHSPIAPKMEGRCTVTDAPDALLTQLDGVGYEFQ